MSTTAAADSNNNLDEPKKLFPNGSPDVADELQETLKKLTVEDLVRGETPADIERRCFELCQKYIGGSWAAASGVEDVEVKRISGGMTNQLYQVHLKEGVAKVVNEIYPDEPTDVAIKLYQAKHMKNYIEGEESERLTDIIVLTIISEVGIGPKVYGIFNDGVILAYHKHAQFRPKHQQNPALLQQLAGLIVTVHHLNVPIRKSGNWLVTEMRSMLMQGYSTKDVPALVEELNLELFKKRDLLVEFESLEKLLTELNAPKVFCHNDFRGSNILVTEPDQKILLCDLEYAAYGARGFDLASFLTEWNRELFDFEKFSLPEDSAIENFAKLYIEAAEKAAPGYAAKAVNQVDVLVREIKLYILANFMFFLAFMFKQTESLLPQIPFDPKSQMTYVNKYYGNYLDIKQKLIESGVIKKEEEN